MTPFVGPMPIGSYRMDVDSETQLGIYYDLDGELMPLMASNRRHQHATFDEWKTPTGTTNLRDGDPRRPPPEAIDYTQDQSAD